MMFDGPSKKGTCVSGTLDGLCGAGPRCDGRHKHKKSHGLDDDGAFRTAKLARYPPKLCYFLAECIVGTLLRFRSEGSGPTGWRRGSLPSKRVSCWSCKATTGGGQAVSILNEAVARGECVIGGTAIDRSPARGRCTHPGRQSTQRLHERDNAYVC